MTYKVSGPLYSVKVGRVPFKSREGEPFGPEAPIVFLSFYDEDGHVATSWLTVAAVGHLVTEINSVLDIEALKLKTLVGHAKLRIAEHLAIEDFEEAETDSFDPPVMGHAEEG